MKPFQLENSTKIILKVVFVGVALVFLWLVRDVLLILLLSLILASAMEPLVDYFKQHKIPRPVSVIAVYILVLGLLVLFSYAIVPLVVEQFKILVQNLPQYIQQFQLRFGTVLGSDSAANLFNQLLGGITNEGNVVSSTFGIFNGVISLISILIISFYLVAEQAGMKRFVATFIPSSHHEFSLNLLEKIQHKMGMWILGQLIASLVMFIITWIGLSALHIQYALVLAIIAGVLEVIPYIGPIVSAVPAMFFGLVQGGPGLSFLVAMLYFLLHELEGYVLIPTIMEKTVGGSPLIILLAVLIGFKLAGPIGIIVAIPLVGAVNVAINEFWPDKTAL